jgi:hypothetical protein
MDIANFIPTLLKTVNSALCDAREHWNANKEKLEKMDKYLPEHLCLDGKRIRTYNLYGTNVEIRYYELFIPCMQVSPTGITLLISFNIEEERYSFQFSTECNEEMVRRGFAHIFYCKTLQINKYLETLEEINEALTNLSK